MKIKVYGSGCPKCITLEGNIKKALEEENKKADIEKVTDMNKIIESGIMITPALEIDGKVVSSGRILSPSEIKELLK
jgi:small redox-active disulfide protein 2